MSTPTSTKPATQRAPDQPLVLWLPESASDGHFWVLQCMHAGGTGVWECRNCGMKEVSKKVLGFLVAAPHWADLKDRTRCETLVVQQVHDF